MLKITPTIYTEWPHNWFDVPLILRAIVPWLYAPPDAKTEPMDALPSAHGEYDTEPMKTLILPETLVS
jgi:hypothetical protein